MVLFVIICFVLIYGLTYYISEATTCRKNQQKPRHASNAVLALNGAAQLTTHCVDRATPAGIFAARADAITSMALIANSGYMGTWAAPVILLSKSPAESDEELLWKGRGLMGNHMKGKLQLAG